MDFIILCPTQIDNAGFKCTNCKDFMDFVIVCPTQMDK
jgi:hypothetical protein